MEHHNDENKFLFQGQGDDREALKDLKGYPNFERSFYDPGTKKNINPPVPNIDVVRAAFPRYGWDEKGNYKFYAPFFYKAKAQLTDTFWTVSLITPAHLYGVTKKLLIASDNGQSDNFNYFFFYINNREFLHTPLDTNTGGGYSSRYTGVPFNMDTKEPFDFVEYFHEQSSIKFLVQNAQIGDTISFTISGEFYKKEA